MDELAKKIDQISNRLTDLRWEIWAEHTLFTWQWWMLLSICIITPFLFIKFVRKEKFLQSFCYFGVIFILNKYMDDLATAMDWYDYRIQLEPIIPTMLAANLFVIPMGLSIIYQRNEKWKPFLIALGLFSMFVSYISLPLMKMVNIYSTKAWNSHWSFISLVIMAVVSKIVVDRIESIQNQKIEQNTESSQHHRRGLILPFPFLRWFRRKEKVK